MRWFSSFYMVISFVNSVTITMWLGVLERAEFWENTRYFSHQIFLKLFKFEQFFYSTSKVQLHNFNWQFLLCTDFESDFVLYETGWTHRYFSTNSFNPSLFCIKLIESISISQKKIFESIAISHKLCKNSTQHSKFIYLLHSQHTTEYRLLT